MRMYIYIHAHTHIHIYRHIQFPSGSYFFSIGRRRKTRWELFWGRVGTAAILGFPGHKMLAFERAGQGFRDGWNGDLAHHMDLADAKFFFREMVLPGYCIIECLLYTSGYFLLRFAISLEWWCLGNSPILRALWSSWWTMIHFARLFLSASCIYLKNS